MQLKYISVRNQDLRLMVMREKDTKDCISTVLENHYVTIAYIYHMWFSLDVNILQVHIYIHVHNMYIYAVMLIFKH